MIEAQDDRQKYYSIRELARMFRVEQQTIRAWIRAGKMTAIKVGGRVLIPAAEVRKLEGGQSGE